MVSIHSRGVSNSARLCEAVRDSHDSPEVTRSIPTNTKFHSPRTSRIKRDGAAYRNYSGSIPFLFVGASPTISTLLLGLAAREDHLHELDVFCDRQSFRKQIGELQPSRKVSQ